ncbi:redox-regulated ATPase YchF [Candidatus Endowatersipora endosymbiont of Watersipora subatra]|uniref:redox-regulated ATPase YchF n=1 Tax=Candidatus Endowatersipora endosymbiont of Watersipora subatra TaxID=3077946 RepID=UPI00312C70CC
MSFKCGIIGLPNVGKSTLFNALTRTNSAQAENYPFCTIEPNTGEVTVPDIRLDEISKIASSKKIIPTQISFIDIAGLVRGSSKGQGLGNQFLSNIREVDAIIHVLRCFEDNNITHVEGKVNPINDVDTIETELMLADLESLEGQIKQISKKVNRKNEEEMSILPIMEKAMDCLNKGKPARLIAKKSSSDDLKRLKRLNLLTANPVLYVCNVLERDAINGNENSRKIKAIAEGQKTESITLSATLEEELAQLSKKEQHEFLEMIGLEESGIDRLIRAGYKLLSLITYFTAGPKETRAWTVVSGTKAPEAAGVIHTDFKRGFIRAQTIAFNDYIFLGGEGPSKEAGKTRDEGKEYIVKDGDIILFKFS